METQEHKQKRPADQIRAETKSEGAIFLSFRRPAQTTTKWYNEWVAMQKYGFFVLSTACILPYKYFRKSNKKGHKLKGHKRAVHCFHNREPDKTERRNQHGWPCDEQISHLCHNPDCCNPLHLVIEFRWKNVRRNYCGEKGVCDCGMQPPCIRTYTNPETFASDWTIETDIQKVRQLLSALHTAYPFEVLPMTYFDTEDEKKKNKRERKERAKKHEKQHIKKAKLEQ
jgi:hypothetical protein